MKSVLCYHNHIQEKIFALCGGCECLGALTVRSRIKFSVVSYTMCDIDKENLILFSTLFGDWNDSAEYIICFIVGKFLWFSKLSSIYMHFVHFVHQTHNGLVELKCVPKEMSCINSYFIYWQICFCIGACALTPTIQQTRAFHS